MQGLGSVKDEIMQVSRLNITEPLSSTSTFYKQKDPQRIRDAMKGKSKTSSSEDYERTLKAPSVFPMSQSTAPEQGTMWASGTRDGSAMPRSLLYAVAEEKFTTDSGGKSALNINTKEAVGQHYFEIFVTHSQSLFSFILVVAIKFVYPSQHSVDAADLVSSSIIQSIILRHVVSPLFPPSLQCVTITIAFCIAGK
jgi:hypothetical protein